MSVIGQAVTSVGSQKNVEGSNTFDRKQDVR